MTTRPRLLDVATTVETCLSFRRSIEQEEVLHFSEFLRNYDFVNTVCLLQQVLHIVLVLSATAMPTVPGFSLKRHTVAKAPCFEVSAPRCFFFFYVYKDLNVHARHSSSRKTLAVCTWHAFVRK